MPHTARGSGKWAFEYLEFPLDLSLSLEELVAQARYDEVAVCSLERYRRFVQPGRREVFVARVALVRREGGSYTEDGALKELSALGYGPSSLRRLLALAIHHPDIQLQGPIFILGTYVRAPPPVTTLYLGSKDEHRLLAERRPTGTIAPEARMLVDIST